MKKKLLSFSIAVILLAGTGTGVLYAGFSKSYAGTSTAQFLKLGAGARATGMGDVQVSCVNDPNAIYWNPAGLNYIEKQSLSVTHIIWFEDIYYDWFSYAFKTEKSGIFGLGVQYLSYGDISATDITGAKTGTFSPNDTAFTLSYAKKFGNVLAGVNAKYISCKIEETGTAAAIDAGIIVKPNNDKISIGFAVQNAGTAMKGISKESPLPFSIKAGVTYDISDKWIAGIDLTAPNDNDINLGIGTEYRYRSIFTRLGYNSRTKEIGGMSGLSFGLGVLYKEINIDYAFQPFEYMGDAHRFSLTWNFGKGEKGVPKNALKEALPQASVNGKEIQAEKPLLDLTQKDTEVKDTGITIPIKKAGVYEKPKGYYVESTKNMIQFYFDSYELRPDAAKAMNELIDSTKDIKNIKIQVEGHACSIGPNIVNNWISLLRAKQVRNYLIKNGLKKDRVTAVGYGEDKPIASNDTKEDRAKNRRVEIVILK